MVIGSGSLAIGETQFELDRTLEGIAQHPLNFFEIAVFDPVMDESTGCAQDGAIFAKFERFESA